MYIQHFKLKCLRDRVQMKRGDGIDWRGVEY